jgi:hypothetical protein
MTNSKMHSFLESFIGKIQYLIYLPHYKGLLTSKQRSFTINHSLGILNAMKGIGIGNQFILIFFKAVQTSSLIHFRSTSKIISTIIMNAQVALQLPAKVSYKPMGVTIHLTNIIQLHRP